MIREKRIKPFLRWAGGKVHLIKELQKYIPKDYMKRIYREPFLGGGSMFFAMHPQNAILSDLNPHLIHCYRMVRDYPEKIYNRLRQFLEMHSSHFYYRVREEYNTSDESIDQAARFIYLNKTSFNGIFRVNKKGFFNVPCGRRKNPAFPSLDNLKSISSLLKNAELLTCSFEKALEGARKGEFIYLDPPYPPLNGTACFRHYTKERFGHDDQVKLADIAQKLNNDKCFIMISNADTPIIRKLYKDWNIFVTPVTRWITCKKIKHKINELVITNY